MAEVLRGVVDKAKAALTDGTDLILCIVGAGAPAAVIEVVRGWFPEQTEGIEDETLAAGVGFALFYFGDRIHKRVVPFGLGMFLAAVGAWSSEWVAGLILMLKKKGE